MSALAIPTELTQRDQWVNWQFVTRKGKRTKVPFQPDGQPASSTDPATWRTYDSVCEAHQRNVEAFAGIGFVFCPDDPYCGIDLDNCLGESGDPKPWAVPFLDTFADTYTEVSPSGRGVKIFSKGKLPDKGKRRDYEDGKIEVYDRGRFFTVTGNVLNGCPLLINEHQRDVDQFYKLAAQGSTRNGGVPKNEGRIPQGHRHDTLVSLAGTMRRRGMSVDAIDAALWAENSARCDPPYDRHHIRKIAESAGGWEPGKPWGKVNRSKDVQFEGGVQDASEREPLSVITVSNRQLRDSTRESLDALNKTNDPPCLFARSGSMVAVTRNELGRLVISEVTEHSLRGHLSEAADFQAYSKKAEKPSNVPPPMNVVQTILSMAPAEWGFLPLDGIVEAPVLRFDGSILGTAGYDSATRLFYAPDPNLRIPVMPDCPTADHVDVARETVLELIQDFPFVDQASRANAFAALLTPIIKPAISKPTPLGAISATAAGTGKSLLAELVSISATGRSAEMLSAPQDQDEWRKQITTALINGASVIVFDNVRQRLDSGELCKVLTADVYADRRLGTNEPIRIPVQCAWFATGNNIQLGGDMPRRCYWIRMDAKMSAPFLRTNFSHPDLKGYATAHRGNILAALLTLARAWFVAGKPNPAVTPIGGFEDWTVMVGGILANAGIEGFLGNSAEAYKQADQEGIEWELFFHVLNEVFNGEPFLVSQIADAACKVRNAPETETTRKLRESLPGTLLEVQEQQGKFVRRLGKCFAALEGRRFGSDEIHVVRTEIVHKVQEWQIRGGLHNSA